MKSPLTLVKAILPRGLLGRSLLILVTPLVLLQIVSAYVFFGTHWDVVTRRLALGLAGDIGTVVELMRTFPGPENRDRIFSIALSEMELRVTYREGAILAKNGMVGAASQFENAITGYSLEENLTNSLNELVQRPVFIDTATFGRDVLVQVQLSDGILEVRTSRKRLYSPTTTIFVLWMIGTSLLLLGIASLFMRNQVRAVRRLAAAADAFGRGHDTANFRPTGAAEVRQAAAAFALMRERIMRQIEQRTEMLAGVSHDLRTPLTRMKLQLAMMKGDGVGELQTDVSDMERMIEGYLAFARGDGAEATENVDVSGLITDIVNKASRRGDAIDLHCEETITGELRRDAVTRALTNLLDNAVRHGDHVSVRLGRRGNSIELLIDDDGPGIPAELREDAFRAFVRLDPARSPDAGGVGLGLTIARDVVRGHGGDVTLEDSPQGGLRARVRLPV